MNEIMNRVKEENKLFQQQLCCVIVMTTTFVAMVAFVTTGTSLPIAAWGTRLKSP